MLGPRSRSEIDFLEIKVRKCSKLKETPPFSYLRDMVAEIITPPLKTPILGGVTNIGISFKVKVRLT